MATHVRTGSRCLWRARNVPHRRHGIIRYRHAGDLNPRVWEEETSRCGRNTVRRPHNEVFIGRLMLMISGSALATIDVLQFKEKRRSSSSGNSLKNYAARNAKQQHCRFQLDDCHRPAPESVELMQEGKSKKEIVDYMVAR